MRHTVLLAIIVSLAASSAHATDTAAVDPAPATAAAEDEGWTAEDIADFERKATAGNVDAMYNLGLAYAAGEGAPQDFALARTWYLKAANLGSRDAMNNLGALYSNGQGVPINYATAMKWYRKAAALGDHTAMNNIAFAYDVGLGVPVNDVEAVRWYRMAADAGNADAAFNLGIMYENGEGVLRNYTEAAACYRRAMLSTDPDMQAKARKALDRVTSPSVALPVV